MKKVKKIAFPSILLILVVVWKLGPHPVTPDYHTYVPAPPSSPAEADSLLKAHEACFDIKPENEARIIWANDSIKAATEYVIVYLHGFGACQEEGNPVHIRAARKFGCNLLLTRLSDHGLNNSVNLQHFTVQRLWNSALESLSLSRALGQKIILMGTSTGGTLALKMASLFDDVEAVILMSPNVKIRSGMAWMINNRWGLQIARTLRGTDKMVSDNKEEWYARYWYPEYGLEAVAQLQELTETSMTPKVFSKIDQPLLLLYYYKDEEHQDPVVSVDAMLKMYDELGTPDSLKRKVAFPNANNHVISCELRSGDLEGVMNAVDSFLGQVVFNDYSFRKSSRKEKHYSVSQYMGSSIIPNL
jgi:esterase/lipase